MSGTVYAALKWRTTNAKVLLRFFPSWFCIYLLKFHKCSQENEFPRPQIRGYVPFRTFILLLLAIGLTDLPDFLNRNQNVLCIIARSPPRLH